jgi:hypothetical protein
VVRVVANGTLSAHEKKTSEVRSDMRITSRAHTMIVNAHCRPASAASACVSVCLIKVPFYLN